MNSTDSGAPSGRVPPIRRPYLPEILSLAIERVPFKPPTYKFVRSVYEGIDEAVAFVVELDADLPLNRDATPVLYVGDVELSYAEPLGGSRYRFLAFRAEEQAIRSGAPISLGWPGHKPHQQTRFWYEPRTGPRSSQ